MEQPVPPPKLVQFRHDDRLLQVANPDIDFDAPHATTAAQLAAGDPMVEVLVGETLAWVGGHSAALAEGDRLRD